MKLVLWLIRTTTRVRRVASFYPFKLITPPLSYIDTILPFSPYAKHILMYLNHNVASIQINYLLITISQNDIPDH